MRRYCRPGFAGSPVAVLLDGDAVRVWVGGFAVSFREARADLDELDRQSGDGDFGSNLLSAIDRGESELEGAPGAAADAVFATVSKAFMHAGGTSGPLFGVWFREFARASTDAGGLDRDGLARAVSGGLAAVQGLGQAQPGDKTMVDAIAPAADAPSSWSIDSSLAAWMKPQVLTTTTSGAACSPPPSPSAPGPSTSVQPATSSRAASSSESTSLRAQPSVTRLTVRPFRPGFP